MEVITKIFEILEKSRIANDSYLPYWIYKIENVVISNKFFIKIYLFNKEFDGKKLDSIVFAYNNSEYNAYNFQVVSEFNDENILGVAIEVPEEILNNHNNLKITKEIVDGKTFDYSNNQVIYRKNKSPEENDYLIKKLAIYKKYHEFYPKIEKNYWQCSCGRIHFIDAEKCYCGSTKIDMIDILGFDFVENHIKDWLKKGIDYDISKTFEENLNDGISLFSKKFEINEELVKDRVDVNAEMEKYTSLVKEYQETKTKRKKLGKIALCICSFLMGVAIILFVFFPDYIIYFKYRFLVGDYQEKYIALCKLNILDSGLATDKAFKNRMISLFNNGEYQNVINMVEGDNSCSSKIEKTNTGEYIFLDKEIEYMYVESMYRYSLDLIEKEEKIEYAVKILEKLGNYKDSYEKTKEAKLIYCKINGSKYNNKAYEYLIDLLSIEYPGAESLYDELYGWNANVSINDDAISVKYNEYTYVDIEITGGEPETEKSFRTVYYYPNGEILYGDYYSTVGWEETPIMYGIEYADGCMDGPRFEGTYFTVMVEDELGNVVGMDDIIVIK